MNERDILVEDIAAGDQLILRNRVHTVVRVELNRRLNDSHVFTTRIDDGELIPVEFTLWADGEKTVRKVIG